MLNCLLLALAALAVPACHTAQVETLPAAAALSAQEPSKAGVLADLARYGNMVREIGQKQLEQQYRDVALANDSMLSSEEAIKLSLLLSVPDAAFQDVDQATRFLRDVVHREAAEEPELAEFARLLYNLLRERVYSKTDEDATVAMLAEERDRNEQLNSELTKVRNALALERKQRETLEGQLEALKKLEEQLSREDLQR
ncbi:MAG TPA: hypothetical protein VFV10_19445 [Gammaproteobacteria bacterium]|nr:hypothetical protein [Gammaproteobacteria bacterium]